MLYPRAPTDAYRTDLRALGDRLTFGDSDAAWLVIATVMHRLAQLPAGARREYAKRAAAMWREAPEFSVGDVCEALAGLAEPAGPQRVIFAIQDVVEEMEKSGAFHLAYTTLAATRLAFPEAGPGALGRVLVQQARVARQLGELDTAALLYEAATEVAESCGDSELLGRAAVGKGVLANMRGNYPDARAAFNAALSVAAEVPAVTAGAHQGLMIAASAAGDVNTALAHGWRAFEGAAGDAHRRADMLINLAELCRKAGQYSAALRGYQGALALTSLARMRLPALGGAAIAAAHLGNHVLLAELARRAEEEIATSGQPYENAFTWLELSEAHTLVGASAEAERYRTKATELALAGRFHELQHRADLLTAQRLAPRQLPDDLTDVSRAVVQHLAGLPEDTSVAVLLG